MRQSPRDSWEETRRDLRQVTWAVLLFDVIALCLGGLLSRPLGPDMWLVGIGVAAHVTLCFAVLIACDLAMVTLVNCWTTRRDRDRDG